MRALPPSSSRVALPAPPPSAPGLPSKPTWVDPAKDKEKEKEIAALVGSNASIVANRKAIRMANLSAAEMIKAELAAGGTDATAAKKNLSAAELLKRELAGGSEEVEKEMEVEKETEKATEVEDVVEEMPASDASVSKGVKRTADEVAQEDKEDDDEDEDEDEVDAFLAAALIPQLPPAVAAPLTIKLLGNNVVEQEDTVK